MSSYETKKIFSQNLTRLLERSGFTQLDLANKMNVAASTVSSWCSGEKMPRMDKVERMAQFFDVPTSYLIEANQPAAKQNLIKIAGRDGSFRERQLTDEQMAAFNAMLDALPEFSDDL